MAGTFSSVNGALSALRYHQVVMDVASGNVANAATDGYTRRRVAGESVGAPAQPAMWSRYDGSGNGVRVAGVDRMADQFLDARARREHGSQAYLDLRQVTLTRVETGVGEPGDSGVAAALAQFRSGWHEVANSPDSDAARSQLLARASSLADALRLQSRNVSAEEGDQRFQLLAGVAEVNTVASDLARVEAGVGEPGDNGVAAALAQFRSGWHEVANSPDSDAARSQLLARASSLADALRLQSRNVSAEEGDQRFQLLAGVAEVNTVASDLAAANNSIAVANLNGTDTGTLLDKRDQLAMRLSELTGSVATIRPDGGFDVSVNGVPLVAGKDAARLEVATGVTPAGADDGNPVTFRVVSASGTTAVPTGMLGEVGSVADLLTTTLPAYRSGLDAVARTLADEMNAQHTLGYDRQGAAGQAMFDYDPADPAGTLVVALADPALVAASGVPGAGLDTGNATAMIAEISVEDDYQRLVNGLGSEVASVRRLALNQQTLTAQLDAAREQLSGVNLDEEMVTMLTAQRAYEAAARVMTTVDSVLDTLINRTGLVR